MALGEGRTQEGTYDTSASLEKHSLKYLNLEKLEKVVGEMEAIDKAITRVKDTVSAIRIQLERDWRGDAAQAYTRQYARLNNDLKDFEDGFKDVSTMLRETSNAFRETDQELFRAMDQAAKKKSDGEGSGSEKGDVRPSTEAELENAMDADLEDGQRPGKDEINSTIDPSNPADLDPYRRPSKDELTSTMEDEEPANLTDWTRARREELFSTIEEAYWAVFDTRKLEPKPELSSTMEPERPALLTAEVRNHLEEIFSTMDEVQKAELLAALRGYLDELYSTVGPERAAVLIRGAMRGELPELYSMVEEAVNAEFDAQARALLDELHSELPPEYTPLFEALMREANEEMYSTMEGDYFAQFDALTRAARDELFSTMEAEYNPQFETRRRAYRMEPRMMLFMMVAAVLIEDSRRGARPDQMQSGTVDVVTQAERQKEPTRIFRDVVRSVISEASQPYVIQNALRARMSDAVNTVIQDMPAVLNEGAIKGTIKVEAGGSTVEMTEAVLADYNRGSEGYKVVQKSILTEKVTTIMADSAVNGRTRRETEIAIGGQVIDQIAPANLTIPGGQRAAVAETVGARIYEYTANRVSYDTMRVSGMSAADTVQAVVVENAAASAVIRQ